MPSNSVTPYTVLKKLRTKDAGIRRKYRILYSSLFKFSNAPGSNKLLCLVSDKGLRYDIVENQIINYSKLLEGEFNTSVEVNIEEKKLKINNVVINFSLKTEIENTTKEEDNSTKNKEKYPSNFLQPGYFKLSGKSIKSNQYVKSIQQKIDNDLILEKQQKEYLKKLLANPNRTNFGNISGYRFEEKFMSIVSKNFSEIIGPLLLIHYLKQNDQLAKNNIVDIKFPLAQNAPFDYTVEYRDGGLLVDWKISIKGGIGQNLSNISTTVNTIKFNQIFDNVNQIYEKRYGKIQTIVAKNIMSMSRNDGPLQAVHEILNLSTPQNKIKSVIAGLFVEGKNQSFAYKQYVVNYIKNLKSYNSEEEIPDEKMVEYVKNRYHAFTGTYKELNFICEKALEHQSKKVSSINSNYRKFVYEYFRRSGVIMQKILISKTKLNAIFSLGDLQTLQNNNKWYSLRRKNSPSRVGHDKLGINPIGR